MSRKEDDENSYTTSEDIVGRSIRRGTRKAVKALTFGILGGDPVKGSFKNLAEDALEELPKAIERSKKNKD